MNVLQKTALAMNFVLVWLLSHISCSLGSMSKLSTFIHYKIIIIYTECSARAYVDYIVVRAV